MCWGGGGGKEGHAARRQELGCHGHCKCPTCALSVLLCGCGLWWYVWLWVVVVYCLVKGAPPLSLSSQACRRPSLDLRRGMKRCLPLLLSLPSPAPTLQGGNFTSAAQGSLLNLRYLGVDPTKVCSRCDCACTTNGVRSMEEQS